jgi:hypothetical protein
MRKYLSLILILFFVSSFAQTEDEEYYNPNFKNWSNSLNNDTSKTKQNIKVGFSTGASVTSGFNGGTGVNTWVAPKVLVPINNRLSIEAGVSYNRGFYNNYNPMYFYGDNDSQNLNGNVSMASFYIKGNYKINEHLTISGATYQSKIIRTKPINHTNPNAFNLDNNGYMVGFNYKFDNGTEVNFQLNLHQGNSPYYMSPYGNTGMGFETSPFGNSFGTGFGM